MQAERADASAHNRRALAGGFSDEALAAELQAEEDASAAAAAGGGGTDDAGGRGGASAGGRKKGPTRGDLYRKKLFRG